jgi:membrane peptidoglycan carboxypeptidase
MSSNQPAASVARTAKIGARVAMLIVLSMVAGVVVAGALLPLVAGVGLSAKAASNDFEALSTTFVTPPLSQQSEIYASDNKTKIATIYYQNRIEVRLSQVAPVMRQALVAVEDGRFYQHNGFDIRGFLRAAVGTSSGGQVQGGSTLTQQYVKQVLINAATTPAQVQEAQARTLTRKIKELRYALAIEKEFSKDQILERYLNIAYFGGGAYGVEAASRRYFNIHASQLSLVQAATDRL